MPLRFLLAFVIVSSTLGAALAAQPPAKGAGKQTKPPRRVKVGYTDTPFLPESRWRVHDANRPHPPVVTPPEPSTQERPGKPPSDAIVLFDGKDLSRWKGREGPAKWRILEDGSMQVNRTGDIETVEHFGDCQLHVEWATPERVVGRSQARGNSGVFLMGRYEIQVLDSYENVTYADGQAAAIYGQKPPDVNACRPPGRWQTYDIVFRAPRFEGDRLVRPAYVTVFHNGVLVHDHVALLGPTRHRAVPKYVPHPPKGPIKLQDHGNPVRYRNIWVRPLPPAGAGGD